MSIKTKRILSWLGLLLVAGVLWLGYHLLPGSDGVYGELCWLLRDTPTRERLRSAQEIIHSCDQSRPDETYDAVLRIMTDGPSDVAANLENIILTYPLGAYLSDDPSVVAFGDWVRSEKNMSRQEYWDATRSRVLGFPNKKPTNQPTTSQPAASQPTSAPQ